MKKVVLILFLSSLFSFPMFSQDYAVEWGPSYKKEGGLFASYRLIGMENDHYYMLMRPRKSNTLLKFDMKHQLVTNRTLGLKHKGKNIRLKQLIRTAKGTYGYMDVRDKEANTWKIFATKFENGNFETPQEIYNHEFKVEISFSILRSSNNQDNLNRVIESQNGNYVAFTNLISTKDQKEEEKIVIALFDADMRLIWDKTQAFPYKDKKLVIEQTIVDNNGVVYLLAKRLERQGIGFPSYSYKVFRITKDGMKEFDIAIGKTAAPMDVALFLPQNTDFDFMVAGFYTNQEPRKDMKGVFFASGKVETGINNINLNEFDKKFMVGLNRKRRIKRNKGLTTNYNIDNFLQYEDGTIGFIAEEDYITTCTDEDGVDTDTYHTNNMIIPRFSTTGELLNIQKINKRFSSGFQDETSYSFALYKNKLYLLFNDYKRKKEAKAMNAKRRWTFTDLVVLDKNGKIESNETLFNSKDIKLLFTPHLSTYSGNKLLIGTTLRKKYSFGVLDLDGKKK